MLLLNKRQIKAQLNKSEEVSNKKLGQGSKAISSNRNNVKVWEGWKKKQEQRMRGVKEKSLVNEMFEQSYQSCANCKAYNCGCGVEGYSKENCEGTWLELLAQE